MSSLNKVILIGNLGKDPESRTMNSGDQVVSFSLATSESWRDKQTGDKRERTEWHNIVIWNQGLGKVAQQYLRKGSKVYLEGQMQTRKWQDQQGQDRYTTEVVLQAFRGELVLLGDSGAGNGSSSAKRDRQQNGTGGSGAQAPRSAVAPETSRADLDDDIPF
jgi:single-strand DNA-binding protein